MQRIYVSKHKTYSEASQARDAQDDGATYQIRRISEGFKLVRRIEVASKKATVDQIDELGYTVAKKRKKRVK